jgi:hypothetical protein
VNPHRGRIPAGILESRTAVARRGGGEPSRRGVMLPLPIEDVTGEIGTIAPDDVFVMGRSPLGWT